MTFTCKFCHKTFEFGDPIEGFPFRLTPTVCDPCDDTVRRQLASEIETQRIAEWSYLAGIYRDTDRNHPSMPSASKQQRIASWKFGPLGLILHGVPRTGKTRCAWLLIKRLMIEGRSVETSTSIALADHLSAMWEAGPEQAAWYKDRLTSADVLFVDDLGKCKMTERVEADMFDVFDRRFSRGLPVIVTTNFVGDVLTRKFSPDRGPAFVARLREFCDAISL